MPNERRKEKKKGTSQSDTSNNKNKLDNDDCLNEFLERSAQEISLIINNTIQKKIVEILLTFWEVMPKKNTKDVVEMASYFDSQYNKKKAQHLCLGKKEVFEDHEKNTWKSIIENIRASIKTSNAKEQKACTDLLNKFSHIVQNAGFEQLNTNCYDPYCANCYQKIIKYKQQFTEYTRIEIQKYENIRKSDEHASLMETYEKQIELLTKNNEKLSHELKTTQENQIAEAEVLKTSGVLEYEESIKKLEYENEKLHNSVAVYKRRYKNMQNQVVSLSKNNSNILLTNASLNQNSLVLTRKMRKLQKTATKFQNYTVGLSKVYNDKLTLVQQNLHDYIEINQRHKSETKKLVEFNAIATKVYEDEITSMDEQIKDLSAKSSEYKNEIKHLKLDLCIYKLKLDSAKRLLESMNQKKKSVLNSSP